MKRLVLLLVALALVCGLVEGSTYDTFQDYRNNSWEAGLHAPTAVYGEIGSDARSRPTNLHPEAFSYAAVDGTEDVIGITLYDSNRVWISISGNVVLGPEGHRWEVLVNDSMYPNLYRDGVFIKAMTGPLVTYPYYFEAAKYQTGESQIWDNPIIGSSTSDHHVVSTMPDNWTIVRDIMNPASTGVYALNPSTGEYDVLKNSQDFYIHADTDSLAGLGTEHLLITNMAGTIVNSTAIDSSTPHHLIQYDIDNFLAEAGYAYGQYAVHFDGSSVYDYFFVLGTGATVYFDRDAYSRLDTATATYTIEGDYWDTGTFDYRIDFIDATTWEVVDTNPISTASGSVTYTFAEDDTPGTYYAVLIAKYRTSGLDAWMMLDWADLDAYVTFYGHVTDENGNPISGANVSVTQGDLYDNEITIADGNYTSTGIYYGLLTRLNVTASGYTQWNVSLVPPVAKRIHLNFTLPSLTPAYNGSAIGGVAHDGVLNDTTHIITNGYGRPLADVNVSVIYGTETHYRSTNIAGWYMCSEAETCYLTPGLRYDVNGTKAGYNNSPTYIVVAP